MEPTSESKCEPCQETTAYQEGVEVFRRFLQDFVVDAKILKVYVRRHLASQAAFQARSFSYRTSYDVGPGSIDGQSIHLDEGDRSHILWYSLPKRTVEQSSRFRIPISGIDDEDFPLVPCTDPNRTHQLDIRISISTDPPHTAHDLLTIVWKMEDIICTGCNLSSIKCKCVACVGTLNFSDELMSLCIGVKFIPYAATANNQKSWVLDELVVSDSLSRKPCVAEIAKKLTAKKRKRNKEVYESENGTKASKSTDSTTNTTKTETR